MNTLYRHIRWFCLQSIIMFLLLACGTIEGKRDVVSNSKGDVRDTTVSNDLADVARTIVDTVFECATDEGHAVTARIMNSSGEDVLFESMEGAKPRSISNTEKKARAALTFAVATSELGVRAKLEPELAEQDHFFATRGGVPVFSAGGVRLLGSVGVAGAPGVVDERCARRAIQAVGLAERGVSTAP